MKQLFIILFIFLSIASDSDASPSSHLYGRQVVKGRRAELYQRYSQRDNLAVAQIEGFRLNDTVKVDVIILVADDAKEWESLCKEFDIRDNHGVTTWTGNSSHPERRIRWNGSPCCKVIASPAKRTICLYLINDNTDYESLMDYQLNLMMNKTKK